MVTSSKTTFREKENIDGLTEEFIQDNGLTTKWRAQEHSLGVMVENMLESIKTIRNMEPAHLNGQMVGSTLVTGKMANNMVRETTSRKAKIEEVYGKWVNESTGLKNND